MVDMPGRAMSYNVAVADLADVLRVCAEAAESGVPESPAPHGA